MSETIAQKIAWLLPRRVVYWAFIRVWAYATGEKYPTTEAPSIHCDTALARWEMWPQLHEAQPDAD